MRTSDLWKKLKANERAQIVAQYNQVCTVKGILEQRQEEREAEEIAHEIERDILQKVNALKTQGRHNTIEARAIFEAEKLAQQGNEQVDVDAGNSKVRKKLKPLERETNEALLLIYEIFNYYKVEYLDELPAQKAWGKIISKEFNSDLLSSIAGLNKSITLSGGEKLSKTDFSNKYRRRFK